MSSQWLQPYANAVGKTYLTEQQLQDFVDNGEFPQDQIEAIRKYFAQKPGHILLQGTISTSMSLEVALQFSKAEDETKKSVLFVYVIHNYNEKTPYSGFRLNKPTFSAHHYEQEVLLMEGTVVYVMGVEEIFVDANQPIENRVSDIWQKLNGKTITVVYLFHAINDPD